MSPFILVVFWVALAVIFAIGEFMTISFFLLPFSIGSIAALIAHLLGAELWLQIVVFLLVASVLIPALRPFARRVTKNAPPQTSGINRLIGKEALVLKSIHAETGEGACVIEGERWLATTQEPHTDVLSEGDRAIVVGVSGTRVVLVPVSADAHTKTSATACDISA